MRDQSTPATTEETTEERYDGRIRPGERRSPATEFKPGQHWRPRKPYWDREWMHDAYVVQQRSASDIAAEFGITDAAVYHWLRKHGIQRRTIAETRAIKHWGAFGPDNPMYGMRGPKNHNWQGGHTPERQAFYASCEWRDVQRLVWKRDRGTCQRCGVIANDGTKMHIHHIAPFRHRELRAEPSNLVLLCVKCHRWVHSKANTDRQFIRQGRR